MNKYRTELLERLDKKANCKVGKQCGDICIPKQSKCQLNAPDVPKVSPELVKGIASGAGILGMSTASYLAFRAKYRAGFAESAQMAEKMANDVKVDDIPSEQTKITFATGGFYGSMGAEGKKKAEDYFSYKLKTNILDADHHVITHRNDEFNNVENPALIKVTELAKEGKKPDPILFAQMGIQVVADHYKQTLETALVKGRNPESVKLASEVIAYNKKYPDKEIYLTGHSAGGMINHEAAEILDKLKIKVNVVNFGSGYFGLTEKVGNSATIVDRGDFYFKSMAGVRDPIYVGEDKVTEEDKHSVRPYMNSPEVVKTAKSLFNQKQNTKKDSADNKGRKCGESHIPKKFKCKKNGKIQKVSDNTKLASVALAGIGLAALPVGAIAAMRSNYIANLPKSAEDVKRQGKAIDPGTLKDFGDKQDILFYQKGFNSHKDSIKLESHLNSLFENSGVVVRNNKDFNFPNISIDSPDFKERFIQSAVTTTIKPILYDGRNPESIALASEIYAYHLKYPDKSINIIGHSAGGMIVREASNILDKLEIKHNVAAIASPDFGLFNTKNYMAINSDKDPLSLILPNAKATKVSVEGHSGGDYLSDAKTVDLLKKHFGNDIKTDSALSTQDKIQIQCKILLSRASKESITKISNVKATSNDSLSGLFSIKNKTFKFDINDKNITYSAVTTRIDSFQRFVRFDAKKKKCKIGIACGETCIGSRKKCELSISAIAKPSEMRQLKMTASKLFVEQNPINATKPEKTVNNYEINPDTKQPYTIRELKKIAGSRGIFGYGSMTVKELKESLSLNDKDPDSGRRIVEGIFKKRPTSSRLIDASGLKGKNKGTEGKAKKTINELLDNWKRIEALSKFAGNNTLQWSAAAVGAFLIGTTVRTYEKVKEDYRDGFDESAKIAQERAVKINLQHPEESNGKPVIRNGKQVMTSQIKQDNITFAVGSGKGHGAEEIKSLLLDGEKGDKSEDWLKKSHYIIPFNLQETGSPKISTTGNPVIDAANDVINGVGDSMRNWRRKRNQDAVDLAAQIYAHAIAVDQSDGKILVNANKKINLLAHGYGGQVVKEAMEILARMEIKGSPSGKEVLNQVNAVYLGTPHFGFAENVSRRQRTIVSQQDPVAMLPTFGDGARQQWISSVPGHAPSDYLKDPRVRESVKEAFGYYQGSPEEIRRTQRKQRARLSFKPKSSKPTEPPENKQNNSDSYNIQYQSTIQGIIAKKSNNAYDLARADAMKKANCKVGKPCGDICIPKKNKCESDKPKQSINPALIAGGLGVAGLVTAGGIAASMTGSNSRSGGASASPQTPKQESQEKKPVDPKSLKTAQDIIDNHQSVFRFVVPKRLIDKLKNNQVLDTELMNEIVDNAVYYRNYEKNSPSPEMDFRPNADGLSDDSDFLLEIAHTAPFLGNEKVRYMIKTRINEGNKGVITSMKPMNYMSIKGLKDFNRI